MPRNVLPFSRIALSVAVLTSLALPAFAQSKADGAKAQPAKPAVDYTKEPYVIERRNIVQRYAADGTADIVGFVRTRVQTDAAVHESGLLEFPYAAKQDTLEIDYVKVEKPDGRVVLTPATDIQDLPMEVTREAPFYSDLRVKQIPVKGLSPGDVIEYQIHRKIVHPAAPGEFWVSENFIRENVILSDNLEIRVPKTKYVKVVSKDVQPEIRDEGDDKVYRWKTSHIDLTESNPAKKKTKKETEQPSVELTTFHDWAAVGAWYEGLQKDRVEVTPDIQAKEKELTVSAKTDEEKIQALYIYVATQFRYIGVDFGVGRYQPHRASEVLDNQYGDCKDKHTLLAALLKAAGFSALPVLVNPVAKFRSEVPSPSQFNHVITAVPLGGKLLWMDATTEVAPFQWLSPPLRGEQGLLIPDTGDAHLERMPAEPPYPAQSTWAAVGTLTKDGVYTGHFEISMRDDFEVVLRTVYRNTARADWDATTGKLMNAYGFGGTVTHAEPSAPEDLTKPFHLAFNYERKDFGDWDNHRTFPMLPIWFFLGGGKDDPKPADPIYVGMPGTVEFTSSTKLPDGFGADLPAATTVKTDFIDYSNVYSLVKGNFLAERKFVLKVGKIDPSAWTEYLRLEKAVADNEDKMVQLTAPGDGGAKTEDAGNERAQELVLAAYNAIKSGDKQKAWQDLDEAKKANPNQQGLWSQYGYLDALDGHFDQAMIAFRKEVDNHPSEVARNLQWVRVLAQFNRPDDALDLARAVAKSAPDNAEAQRELGDMLTRAGKMDEAMGVLEKVVSGPNPTDQAKLALAVAYLKQQRKPDAEKLLLAILASSKDAEMLNSAAYELADADLDLEQAHTAAQKALEMQETKFANLTLDVVTNADFAAALQFSATWDTVGWIYFRQGNLASAEQYLKAAWILGQRQVIGNHLADVYEKQGKAALARDTRALANLTAPRASNAMPSHAELMHDRAAQIGTKHASPEDLAKIRSVELPTRKTSQMSAEFYVLFSAQGIEAAKFISGNEELKDEVKTLMKAKFDEPFPPGSKARVIRRGIMACSSVIGNCQFVMLLPNESHAD